MIETVYAEVNDLANNALADDRNRAVRDAADTVAIPGPHHLTDLHPVTDREIDPSQVTTRAIRGVREYGAGGPGRRPLPRPAGAVVRWGEDDQPGLGGPGGAGTAVAECVAVAASCALQELGEGGEVADDEVEVDVQGLLGHLCGDDDQRLGGAVGLRAGQVQDGAGDLLALHTGIRACSSRTRTPRLPCRRVRAW